MQFLKLLSQNNLRQIDMPLKSINPNLELEQISYPKKRAKLILKQKALYKNKNIFRLEKRFSLGINEQANFNEYYNKVNESRNPNNI